MTWQLEEMQEKGIAGTWFYPRFARGEDLSSNQPFWSDEWWDFVRFSLEEHRRLGMVHWYLDWTNISVEKEKIVLFILFFSFLPL